AYDVLFGYHLPKFRVLVENGSEVSESVGSFTTLACDRAHEGLVLVVDLVGGFDRERLRAPDTEWLLSGRFALTSRAGDRPDLGGLVFVGDLDAVHPSVLGFGFTTETSDVPGDVFGATLATLTILDERSVRPTASE